MRLGNCADVVDEITPLPKNPSRFLKRLQYIDN